MVEVVDLALGKLQLASKSPRTELFCSLERVRASRNENALGLFLTRERAATGPIVLQSKPISSKRQLCYTPTLEPIAALLRWHYSDPQAIPCGHADRDQLCDEPVPRPHAPARDEHGTFHQRDAQRQEARRHHNLSHCNHGSGGANPAFGNYEGVTPLMMAAFANDYRQRSADGVAARTQGHLFRRG